MTATAPDHADHALPALLKRLRQQHADGDLAGSGDTLAALGADRLSQPRTLLGALCVGGSRFATWLAGQAAPGADDETRSVAVLQAFMTAIEPPADAGTDHERRVAGELIETFGLQARPESLIDLVRAEFLIHLGPPTELAEAVLGAMRHQRWDLAFEGVERMRALLGPDTPRDTYGIGAICLHHLGRYAEAERWIDDGLGDDRQRLAVPPAFTEAEHLARWGGRQRPVVSIVCTTYNHERYIAKALQGFLSQDCPYPFEILVHDDASTDRTQDVIRDWHARYPHLIRPVLQTENQFSRGVRPLELLLARAQGDYVATCEGDDYWIAPHKLRQQVGFLMQHPDVSCSAHNYHLFVEASLTVRPWSKIGRDFFVSQRQMMASQMLLWLPTLVFRKTFDTLPPERAMAAFGDQFLVSYLGTQGRCAYFETLTGAVRRENEFSSWTPLPASEKERRRVRTWTAMLRLHERLGNQQAVVDLTAKIAASPLDAAIKAAIAEACPPTRCEQPALA
jgi:hypothetical protein